MSNYVRYYWITGCFAVIGMVFLFGCQESRQGKDSVPIASGPTIVFDCIADYHAPDQSRYVSEQTHVIGVDDKSIRIFASEPGGEFEWQLKDGVFSTGHKLARPVSSSVILCDEDIARGLLGLYTANVDIPDKPSFSAGAESPVEIEGQLYQPLTVDGGLTFCKNLDTGIVDTVLLVGPSKNLTIRGHKYRKLKTMVGMVPRRVEIYSTEPDSNRLELLVKFGSVVSEH